MITLKDMLPLKSIDGKMQKFKVKENHYVWDYINQIYWLVGDHCTGIYPEDMPEDAEFVGWMKIPVE